MLLLKRIVDILVSLVVLIIFSPIILFTAFLILITMGRPILFIQKRPGFKGVPFNIFKFRTMSDQKDKHGNLLPGDKRITKVGNIVRKFSLDELLQLFNVLKGELSLVGPRPLLMEYLERYSKDQMRRHDVMPGITGWAQVNGRNAISWKRRFELDLYYVDNISLYLDFKIISMTFFKIFKSSDINFKSGTTEDYFMGNTEKKLIIMRGLPGSGKSYLAKKLGENGVVFTTDDYFMVKGDYLFDFSQLGKAHSWNLERAKWAMRDELPLIVIDNTNVLPWEPKEYVKFALKYGYEIDLRTPETSWAFDLEELIKRNTHNLPRNVLQRMHNNFVRDITVDDILKSTKP